MTDAARPAPDPHVLGPDLAPTPFTADEIRAACPDSHWVLVRTTGSGEVHHHLSGFAGGDAEGCTSTSVETDASGTPTGQAQARRVTWLELQAHAAFPAASTTIARERIRLAFGERDCLRYEVVDDEGATTFWFALEHPGMPVRWASAGVTAEAVAIGDGGAPGAPRG
ncbi:hypothetical protein [Agrococcus carbonis]|uniref:Uncharacterized protein n=1 Tax=Agrococcus carbonis TaxID=684552 RepID=A0A1H1P4C7_9MICO|nr:hypothetical protein [Agrococcus carbonis]SDS05880.1 hypothetical protein SAMN04489719_1443 [Agrococcus carbonis]